MFGKLKSHLGSQMGSRSKIPPGIPSGIPSGIPLGNPPRIPGGIPTNILHGLSRFPSRNDSNDTVERKWLFSYRSYIFTFSWKMLSGV